MYNDTDSAYIKRVQQALRDFLINQGVYNNIDETFIEVTAGQLALLRMAKRELARFKQENNLEGVELAEEIVREKQLAIDEAVGIFGIDFKQHQELAQLIEQ